MPLLQVEQLGQHLGPTVQLDVHELMLTVPTDSGALPSVVYRLAGPPKRAAVGGRVKHG